MFRSLLFWAVPMLLMAPNGDGGGAGGGGGDGGGAPNPDPGKTVPLADHKKALDEMHSTKETLKQTNAKLETLEATLKKIETDKAASAGDYKSLYEGVVKDKADVEKKFNDFKGAVVQDKRLGVLEGELRKLGLKDGSEGIMDLADINKLPFETTNKGRFLINGADQLAKELETKYPAAFDKGKPAKINTGGGNNGTEPDVTGDLTADYMVELETKDPKKYRELFPKYLEQRKKRISSQNA